MKGDTYKFLNATQYPDHAPSAWAGKVVLVLRNERNGVTNILVFEPDGSPLAWPPGLEPEVDHLAETFAAEIAAAQ